MCMIVTYFINVIITITSRHVLIGITIISLPYDIVIINHYWSIPMMIILLSGDVKVTKQEEE